jgi:hypothetical protein
MKHTITKLGDTKETKFYVVASSSGKGTDKRLVVWTTFDGLGYEDVSFEVIDHNKTQTFPRFDEAVDAYNLAP